MPDEPREKVTDGPPEAQPAGGRAAAGDAPAADVPAAAAPEVADEAPRPGRLRRLAARVPRYSRRAVLLACALVAAALVSVVTIDLGPAVRAQAERAASAQLDRPVRIGRLSSYLVPGRFLVEDLVIGGLEADHEPFLVSERIVVTVSWGALLGGEILIDGAEMHAWRMLVERFPDGRHTFPPFAPQRPADEAPAEPPAPDAADGGRRIVTTVQHMVASAGEFVFRDHGAPWDVTARNIELTIGKRRDIYGGDVSFAGGTVQIGTFEPMTADMQASYTLDGGSVELTRIDLTMDGFTSRLDGEVDLFNWPAQIYRIVESDIDLAPMKDIFFAADNFTVDGRAAFTGAWRIFSGGHELTGDFLSPDATFNDLQFPGIGGALAWSPGRFEVSDAYAGFYGGELQFDYSMQPLGKPDPAIATLDVRYGGVELPLLLDTLEVGGVRPRATISGYNLLRWPLDAFAERSGEGRLSVTPPDGVRLMRATAAGPAATPATYAAAAFSPAAPWEFPLGGELTYSITPQRIELEPGRLATPRTEIRFQGWTEYGAESQIPFHVTSSDWQESDRLMAAALTAFGVPTGEIAVGGHGRLDGVMYGTFASPRIEASFEGRDIRAWNVRWGAGRGDIVVENAYLDVNDGRFERDAAALQLNGRFSIGTRADGGDDLDASVELQAFPAERIRQAFGLTGYDVNGALHGSLRLFGRYRSPYGVGRLELQRPVAYGESFDVARAGLRFEGTGVRIDGLEVDKAGGLVTGAAFIGWDGTYSFNAEARDLDVAGIDALRVAQAPPLAGAADFTAEGAGAFEAPRYEARGLVRDLTIAGEAVGQVSGRLDVRAGALVLEAEAASLQGAASVSGRIDLGTTEADLLARFTNANLDPYVRAFQSGLPEQFALQVSGTLQVAGLLRDREQLQVAASVEQLGLDVYGYGMRNDGPVRFALEQNVVGIERMRLTGDEAAFDMDGEIRLADQRLALALDGEAALALLERFFPDVRGSGRVAVAATIDGTFDEPQVTGEAALAAGRFRHLAFPHSFDQIAGRLVFEPSGIRFDEMSAVLGGGSIRFGGRVDMRGYEVVGMNVSAAGEGLRLRFPEGIRSEVDADLVLSGDLAAPVLAGSVDVRDALLLELFGTEADLLNFGGGDEVLAPAAVDPAFPLALDIRISAPSSLRISGTTARATSTAELTVGGTYDQPLLFGSVEIENGEVFFEGNRYRVTRGNVAFTDPRAIDPAFDIEVETDVRTPGQTYRVTLGLAGTMDRLDFELASDPPLPEFEIMQLLLGNIRDPQAAELRTLRAQDASRQEMLQAGAARLLTTPLSSGVGRVVRDSFGIDTFQITPSLVDPSAQQSAQLMPTARLLIGKRISDRAHVTVSRTLTGANQNIIVVLEYDQNDRLSWVLSQNEDRTYALDFRVRHAF